MSYFSEAQNILSSVFLSISSVFSPSGSVDQRDVTSIFSVWLLSNTRWWNRSTVCLFQMAFPVFLLDGLSNAFIVHLGKFT